MSNYEAWQAERYNDILPTPEMEIAEPGELQAQRFAEWLHDQYELQLHEQEL